MPEAPQCNIIKCVELPADVDPRYESDTSLVTTLRDVDLSRIMGRVIVQWSTNMGSYGMGGPGFFGLRLAANDAYPAEWLILTLWGAAQWLLLDGRWLEAHPNQYDAQRPLYSNFPPEFAWDELSPSLLGATIAEAEITGVTSRLVLEKDSVIQVLEIPGDTNRLPLYGGSLQARHWNPAEQHNDAWVLSESGNLLTI